MSLLVWLRNYAKKHGFFSSFFSSFNLIQFISNSTLKQLTMDASTLTPDFLNDVFFRLWDLVTKADVDGIVSLLTQYDFASTSARFATEINHMLDTYPSDEDQRMGCFVVLLNYCFDHRIDCQQTMQQFGLLDLAMENGNVALFKVS